MQTERDAEIVGWIGRVGAASARHVMARFRMGQSVTYERLAALVADGLLEHRMLLYRQPGLYFATADGLRWSGLERLGVDRVGPGGFEHARQVATAAVALHHGLPDAEVLSERELRARENDEGELFGSVKLGSLPGGREALHRPDLLVVTPNKRVVAVEVELSVKAPRRLETICTGYGRARHLHHVYYLAAPAAARAVTRAVAAVRAHDRITVLPLHDVPSLIAAAERGEVDGAPVL